MTAKNFSRKKALNTIQLKQFLNERSGREFGIIMAGTIVNFRGSHRRKKHNQMIVQLDGVTSRDKAKALLGKTAVWSSPGKEPKQINGKISRAHGNEGAVSIVFEKGMPGQSLGTEVEVK